MKTKKSFITCACSLVIVCLFTGVLFAMSANSAQGLQIPFSNNDNQNNDITVQLEKSNQISDIKSDIDKEEPRFVATENHINKKTLNDSLFSFSSTNSAKNLDSNSNFLETQNKQESHQKNDSNTYLNDSSSSNNSDNSNNSENNNFKGLFDDLQPLKDSKISTVQGNISQITGYSDSNGWNIVSPSYEVPVHDLKIGIVEDKRDIKITNIVLTGFFPDFDNLEIKGGKINTIQSTTTQVIIHDITSNSVVISQKNIGPAFAHVSLAKVFAIQGQDVSQYNSEIIIANKSCSAGENVGVLGYYRNEDKAWLCNSHKPVEFFRTEKSGFSKIKQIILKCKDIYVTQPFILLPEKGYVHIDGNYMYIDTENNGGCVDLMAGVASSTGAKIEYAVITGEIAKPPSLGTEIAIDGIKYCYKSIGSSNGFVVTGVVAGMEKKETPIKIKDKIYKKGFLEPVSVIGIDNNAFSNFQTKRIDIPNSIQFIGDGAFEGCKNLENIHIPNSVTSLGANAFKGCVLLENVVVPNQVKLIGKSAFSLCKKMSKITLPGSVELQADANDSSTFSGCVNLKELVFSSLTGKALPSIKGNYAFKDVPQGLNVHYKGKDINVWQNGDISSFDKQLPKNSVWYTDITNQDELKAFSLATMKSIPAQGLLMNDIVFTDSVTSGDIINVKGKKTLTSYGSNHFNIVISNNVFEVQPNNNFNISKINLIGHKICGTSNTK